MYIYIIYIYIVNPLQRLKARFLEIPTFGLSIVFAADILYMWPYIFIVNTLSRHKDGYMSQAQLIVSIIV